MGPVIYLKQLQPNLERRLVPGRSDQEQKAVVFSSCEHGSEPSGVGKKLSTNTTPARGFPSRLLTKEQACPLRAIIGLVHSKNGENQSPETGGNETECGFTRTQTATLERLDRQQTPLSPEE